MNFEKVWNVVRGIKPLRTFWQVLASFIAASSASTTVGFDLINFSWTQALSVSAGAALLSFVTILGSGDSLWSEKKSVPTYQDILDTASEFNPEQELSGGYDEDTETENGEQEKFVDENGENLYEGEHVKNEDEEEPKALG